MIDDVMIKRLAAQCGFTAMADLGEDWYEASPESVAAAFRACYAAGQMDASKTCIEFGKTLEVDVGPNFAEEILARTEGKT